jgi:propionyl-CoA synthetase
MKTIYGISGDDVWWTASDMGWVVGHSYICYAPLCAGVTSVMYEGKPDRTPHPGQYFRYPSGLKTCIKLSKKKKKFKHHYFKLTIYFRVIESHNVNAVFTAPTALRVIKRADPKIKIGNKFCTKS